MELLEVDCGNRVERGLPPLNIPPPPKPTSASLVSLPPSLPWICGWVQQWEVTCGRLWFMWRWVRVRGTWAGGGEKMDPRRDRRRQSDYSLLPPFIFIFKTRRFTRSPSPTSCRYGNLKPGEKPRVGGEKTWWSAQRWTHAEAVLMNPILAAGKPEGGETQEGFWSAASIELIWIWQSGS